MKRLLTVLCMACIGITVAMSAPAPKTEITGSASYFKPDGGGASWALGAEVAFPVSDQGYLLIGPAVSLVNTPDGDFQAIGGVVEFNLMKGSGLFFGGAGLYDPDAPDGADAYTVDARAGFKAALGSGKGGLLKVYLEKTVDGYGKSEDLSGVAAFGVRF